MGQTCKPGYNPTFLPPTAAHNIARLLNMLGFQASHSYYLWPQDVPHFLL